MTKINLTEWEPIIGLEIHAELNTKSKLFSSDANRFGDEPNTNISEVSTALPGSLPVLNEEVVKKAVQFGLSVGAHINLVSQFDRKSYFYPDNPRNFQITQYETPIIMGGQVVAVVDGQEKEFQITRAHIEDDSGMLKHFTTFAGVDYNRAGVPLIEIVSEPCMRTPKDASSYAMAIKAILEYLDASDCNMEEGSLRFDVNISVRKRGEKEFRNKIEIKNMNSFSNLELAIDHEIARQVKAYEANPDKDPKQVITQATHRWDPDQGITVLMRKKEYADDYRYFPEPDLLPLVITQSYVDELTKTLPELPLQKEKRYVETLGLAVSQAFFLASDKKLADYFEAALKSCSNAKNLTNWIIVEFPGRLKEKNLTLYQTPILPEHVAELVELIEKGAIHGKIAKSVADEMVAAQGCRPSEIVAKNPDYQPLNDRGAIETLVDTVLAANQDSIDSVLAGRDRAFAFLVGQVMKATKGTASPQVVNELLKEKIAKIAASK
ncbi:MAG: Asp-tRNA(Asn)/Glu-tRNA(Gln) amidotransferase subunit GatB [Chlamydiales bacterium]|nr:Asp-tRNA(Asn)/Glu-tRNA(Gln) amidotransferase subunit GatB [Chlamydiales bacterium]